MEKTKASSKRGCNIVRERCLQFIEALREQGFTNEVPLETAKQLFQITMGIMDRASLKAYFGSQLGKSVRKIQRVARYSSGTISQKTIELTQVTPQKRGYLELLGLATFELRGKVWFMILKGEPLVPQLFPQHYEGHECSIENLSLSPIQGKECEKTVLEVVSPNNVETKENKQTTTYRVRERNLCEVC